MDVERIASRHGITPMIVMFIVRYSVATAAIESRIERGITRSGLPHLAGEEANVVVPAVIVHRDQGCPAETEEEPTRAMRTRPAENRAPGEY